MPTDRQKIVSLVADKFANLLRRDLTAKEFVEIKRLNETPDFADGCCASHNYLDANMTMDEAMSSILDRPVDIDADEDVRLWADDRAVLLTVRDHVKNAVSQIAFEQRIERMRGLTEIKVTGNPEAAVQVLAKKVGLLESERGGILRSLIEGGDLSAWGMLNAITAQAHSATTYDRSVEFETMGGQLLDLPRSGWREVLEAV